MMSRVLRETWWILLAAANAAAVPSTAAAQETIPREVVTALFGPLRGAELLVERLPDPLPYGIRLPDGVTPIGALVRRGSGVIAVAFLGDAASAETTFLERLTDAGWRPREDPRRGGGFISSGFGYDMRMFCSDDAMLTFSTTRGTGRTIVRINYNAVQGRSPCSPDFGPIGRAEGPVPTLGPPDDAMVRGIGSSSSGDDNFGFRAQLETGLTPDEVARHYGLELTEQDWLPAGAPTLTADVFIQRWANAADDGWTGILLGIRTDPSTYTLDFRMWPTRRR